MLKGLKFAVVSAIFLSPFAYPHSGLARTFLNYQEVSLDVRHGQLEACDAMHAHEAGLLGPGAAP